MPTTPLTPQDDPITRAAKWLAENVMRTKWSGIPQEGRASECGFDPWHMGTCGYNAGREDYRDAVRGVLQAATSQDVESLAAEMERVAAGRAPPPFVHRMIREHDRQVATLKGECNALKAEVSRLTSERDAARRALEPFAWIGQWLFARNIPDDTPAVKFDSINGKEVVLTRGHFKEAHRATLSGGGIDNL